MVYVTRHEFRISDGITGDTGQSARYHKSPTFILSVLLSISGVESIRYRE